ncbi:hypothetical protein H5410_029997 [Solanum commersonii]|uniref:Uncharacterized protein n=1 Tax=Solanum commersonii TaxID=4109 RepID=A0A9J5YD14_SOLCO|nr:hypothetical protein H5410_029997 [Solanum commersonii]
MKEIIKVKVRKVLKSASWRDKEPVGELPNISRVVELIGDKTNVTKLPRTERLYKGLVRSIIRSGLKNRHVESFGDLGHARQTIRWVHLLVLDPPSFMSIV